MGAIEIILLVIVLLPGIIVAMDDAMWDRKKKE